MKWWLVLVIGCGGSQAKPHDVPPLPPEGSAAPLPASGPACMPAGSYAVTWDVSAAEVTGHGEMQGDEGWCTSIARTIPEQTMPRVAIDYDGGTLHVAWPKPMVVTTHGDCAFDVEGEVEIHVTFAGGKGAGTAEYSVGAVNNPQEGSCKVRGVKLSIAPG
jgi:hypothetical protein